MLAAGQRVYLHGGDFASAAIIQIIPFSLFQCLYLPVSDLKHNNPTLLRFLSSNKSVNTRQRLFIKRKMHKKM